MPQVPPSPKNQADTTQPLPVDNEPRPAAPGKPVLTGPHPGDAIANAAKPFPRELIWFLLAIILVLFGLLFFYLTRAQVDRAQLEKNEAAELRQSESVTATGTAVTDRPAAPRAPQIRTFVLPDDDLRGLAPIRVRPSGPLLSPEVDAELAAIVIALKVRVEKLAGSRVTTLDGGFTRLVSGGFRGFTIRSIESIVNGQKTVDEILLTTPSRGQIKVVNGALDSLKNADYQGLYQDLRQSGLEAVKSQSGGSPGQVGMQLRVFKSEAGPIGEDFLIAANRVGKVELGMRLTAMEVLLAGRFTVLKRKILIGDKYYQVYKVVDLQQNPQFFVYIEGGLVKGVEVVSELFKTVKGLGIGSNLASFRIDYDRVTIGSTPGKPPFVMIADVNGHFYLQAEAADFDRKKFADDLKVVTILIGQFPV